MTWNIWGTVKEGVVVPDTPLPEGRRVEIVLTDVPPELQEEWQAWERASSNALELVEHLAKEAERDEKR
jgi:hypothetical protein